jgi:hypothetical protein
MPDGTLALPKVTIPGPLIRIQATGTAPGGRGKTSLTEANKANEERLQGATP